jgi:DNA ligase-1
MRQLTDLTNELKATSSRNEKIEILRDNPWCTDILLRIYHPDILYGVKSAKCRKLDQLNGLPSDSLYHLLDQLLTHSGHDNVRLVNQFVLDNPEYTELIHNVVDKSLKCRIDDTVINMAFPGLIPTFNVALAQTYDKFADRVTPDWLWSRKLDGVRLIVTKRGSDVTYQSREGKYWTSLEALTEQLRAIEGDFVLDGEACIVRDGNEYFSEIVGAVKRKGQTIENPKFFVFDILTIEEFESRTSEAILTERLDRLEFSGKIEKLEQREIGTDGLFEYPKEWEGLILRKNCAYEGKRTSNMLKVKKFQDDEYVVEDLEIGEFQIVEDGQEKIIETVTNISFSHKGEKVGAGSGFSLDQRREYYLDHSKILGKTVTIKHFGESTNKSGKISLRFPTIKLVHGEKRES